MGLPTPSDAEDRRKPGEPATEQPDKGKSVASPALRRDLKVLAAVGIALVVVAHLVGESWNTAGAAILASIVFLVGVLIVLSRDVFRRTRRGAMSHRAGVATVSLLLAVSAALVVGIVASSSSNSGGGDAPSAPRLKSSYGWLC